MVEVPASKVNGVAEISKPFATVRTDEPSVSPLSPEPDAMTKLHDTVWLFVLSVPDSGKMLLVRVSASCSVTSSESAVLLMVSVWNVLPAEVKVTSPEPRNSRSPLPVRVMVDLKVKLP